MKEFFELILGYIKYFWIKPMLYRIKTRAWIKTCSNCYRFSLRGKRQYNVRCGDFLCIRCYRLAMAKFERDRKPHEPGKDRVLYSALPLAK